MAENRIDFTYNGEKYFADMVALTDMRNDDPEKDKGFVVVYDTALLPKGFKFSDGFLSIKKEDGQIRHPEIFSLIPPQGFTYYVGKYPKE